MFIIFSGLTFFLLSFFLYFIIYLYPILRTLYLDWIALFLAFVPFIVIIYRAHTTKCYKQLDKLSPWRHLINYMRRDNEIVPIIGERTYPGESFIDVPKLGLIEFLGKDCVYNWGDKKVMWGLENINYSPDPRYFNFTHLLYELGFRNSEDIKEVLKGENLYLMGKVYLNMLKYDNMHGSARLVNEMKDYDGKIVDFHAYEPKLSTKIEDKIDKIINRGG